ncbi:hypothetical protein [Cognatiyoonia sp. IB215182]|uniref:hypothetical protein n=1 Tax=Cognatiyoonia sp. IB215182 TaxID=3097353 RepID=UPI002A0E6F44|nr:hypothetical protein [Cognatiyoonia sp. IB215182]MDX8352334.1 hypothetical protein [Cognatiyoonia sp. IB215182]
MVRYVAAISLMGLAACVAPVPISSPTPLPTIEPDPEPAPNPRSAKERFVAAVEANGCVMTAQNVRTIMDQATVGTGDLENIIVTLQAEGRAAPDGANIRVITDTCVA